MRRILAVTPGDPAGIGPEIVWKAIRKHRRKWASTPLLCVGARAPFDRLKARVILADPENLIPPRDPRPHVWLLEAPASVIEPERLLEGYQSGWSIQTAAALVQYGFCAALVTGPISKERLQRGGFKYSGHTDFLADLCGVDEVTMMLANDELRVSLVTVHVGLKNVSAKLTRTGVTRAIDQTAEALRDRFGVKKPRIAVCALNPHAGEDGLFGTEERDVIEPALHDIGAHWGNRLEVTGPHPADTYFAHHVATPKKSRPDAVVCMYHDQGLIPVKMLDFARTVNLTLGLPILRTSVDHGTAFDIAGKNRADPSSFVSAVEMARTMTQPRRVPARTRGPAKKKKR